MYDTNFKDISNKIYYEKFQTFVFEILNVNIVFFEFFYKYFFKINIDFLFNFLIGIKYFYILLKYQGVLMMY